MMIEMYQNGELQVSVRAQRKGCSAAKLRLMSASALPSPFVCFCATFHPMLGRRKCARRPPRRQIEVRAHG